LPYDKIPTTESELGLVDQMNIRSCYAESKRIGETMCVAWSHQFGVDARILRIYHTYGPGMKLDDGRVFSDFVNNILNKKNIEVKSDGRAKRPFCYISDNLSGVLHVLFRGESRGAYNIGNDEGLIGIGDLADLLSEVFADRGICAIKAMRDPIQSYLESPITVNCPNTEKLRRLGWSPRVGLVEGFQRTVRHYDFHAAKRNV